MPLLLEIRIHRSGCRRRSEPGSQAYELDLRIISRIERQSHGGPVGLLAGRKKPKATDVFWKIRGFRLQNVAVE